MIKVESLFYKIDQKLDKLSSNYHQSIPEEDKTLAVNEGQIQLIKKKLDGNNIYKLGFDSFKKRYQDLEKFVEDYKDHPLVPHLTDPALNLWTVDISDIQPQYMFYVDSYMMADKGKCKNRVIYVNNDMTKHSDVTILLNNTNYAPSFEYQETFNSLSTDSIWYFTDGTFTPTKIYLSYLRYPAYIHLDDFELPDGTILEGKQDCELAEYLEDELIDIVVRNLATYIENTTAVESSNMRMADDE